MTFEIHYSKAADRDLSKLPNEVIKKIVYAVGDIREDPFAHIQKMKGAKNPPQYKFRVGEYRVILLLDKDEQILLVDGVGHRSTIYQRYGR